ncbi:glycolate oxidase subunit GlcF [Biformimicrobium ophioploci]|uniref:Glycolate oxidase iron-sulfur subunit n=1 Tax=Biformimicrobium ophioploci TaxID=3036711 RepID=A0ABQ6M0V6_9GAMM|nr:glycolate oxidase subunit GlcF [Microbulbifer sp. NKW57]GMG87922.1 glycolate oxidase subunit GlcF [Microbulbifer sp. NKW57]
MYTNFDPKGDERASAAKRAIESCVHCGFCLATCPTYRATGNELDSPRGRIYLMKAALEGEQPSELTLQHLDRCLSCRACETTCPSGVHYHNLLDLGREQVAAEVGRPAPERIKRNILRRFLLSPRLFAAALGFGRFLRPLLPGFLARLVPASRETIAVAGPQSVHARAVLLEGCVQPALEPQINRAARSVLAKVGVDAVCARGEQCCGAMSAHMEQREEARALARRNIDTWLPLLDAGAEALVSTASGCGAFVKEYSHLLADDPEYAQKAQRVAGACKDIAEYLGGKDVEALQVDSAVATAFQCPCSLQHAQGQGAATEQLLQRLGFALVPVADAHQCCGSAGTYSILQPGLSREVRDAKLDKLQAPGPERIASANIGCISQLQPHTQKPVRHWIEYVAMDLGAQARRDS